MKTVRMNVARMKAALPRKLQKLNPVWSLEAVQDLESMHGLNVEKELSKFLAENLIKEIKTNCQSVELDADQIRIFRKIAESFKDKDIEIYQDAMIIKRGQDKFPIFVEIDGSNISVSNINAKIKVDMCRGDPVKRSIKAIKTLIKS